MWRLFTSSPFEHCRAGCRSASDPEVLHQRASPARGELEPAWGAAVANYERGRLRRFLCALARTASPSSLVRTIALVCRPLPSGRALLRPKGSSAPTAPDDSFAAVALTSWAAGERVMAGTCCATRTARVSAGRSLRSSPGLPLTRAGRGRRASPSPRGCRTKQRGGRLFVRSAQSHDSGVNHFGCGGSALAAWAAFTR